jgi:hypothetical protein
MGNVASRLLSTPPAEIALSAIVLFELEVGLSVGWVEPASIMLGFAPQPNLRKSSICREMILMGETQQNRQDGFVRLWSTNQ